MKLSTRAAVVTGVPLLGVTACVPTTATPTPPTSSSWSPTPTSTSTASPLDPEEVEVTAAAVVMTASTLSIFGSDGSTLAAVNYEMDGAAAVAQIAEALDEEPVVTPIPGDVDSPCPPATGYSGGLRGAIGEFMRLYETDTILGFDIVNPEAHEYDRIGAYAEFSGGTLAYLAAPNQLGFVGSCA